MDSDRAVATDLNVMLPYGVVGVGPRTKGIPPLEGVHSICRVLDGRSHRHISGFTLITLEFVLHPRLSINGPS